MFGLKLGKRGQLGMSGAVIAVLMVAIAIILGIIVFASVIGGVPTQNFSAAANVTYNQVITNVWVAIGLIATAIIVMGAATVFMALKLMA